MGQGRAGIQPYDIVYSSREPDRAQQTLMQRPPREAEGETEQPSSLAKGREGGEEGWREGWRGEKLEGAVCVCLCL